MLIFWIVFSSLMEIIFGKLLRIFPFSNKSILTTFNFRRTSKLKKIQIQSALFSSENSPETSQNVCSFSAFLTFQTKSGNPNWLKFRETRIG